MTNRKEQQPIDLTHPRWELYIREIIIPAFAQFKTTKQVVDMIMEAQEKWVVKKHHRYRSEIREMIRTFNPNNAKFNHAKWGELFEECRQEYLADIRSQMSETARLFCVQIQHTIRNMKLQVTDPRELHEMLHLFKTFRDIQSNDESRQQSAAAELTRIFPPERTLETANNGTSQTERIPQKVEKPHHQPQAFPGTNGQKDTV